MFAHEVGIEFYVSRANIWPRRGLMWEYLYRFTFVPGHNRQACSETRPRFVPTRTFRRPPC